MNSILDRLTQDWLSVEIGALDIRWNAQGSIVIASNLGSFASFSQDRFYFFSARRIQVGAPTYEELVEALEGLALQYLTKWDSDTLTHDFMSAGEYALPILERLGSIESIGPAEWRWVEGHENRSGVGMNNSDLSDRPSGES